MQPDDLEFSAPHIIQLIMIKVKVFFYVCILVLKTHFIMKEKITRPDMVLYDHISSLYCPYKRFLPKNGSR